MVADALSRKGQLHAISLVTPKWTNEVEKSYEKDIKCKELLEKLLLSPSNSDQHDTLQNGLIRHKGKFYIGNDMQLKAKLLNAVHSSALGGHSGRKVSYEIIKKIFYGMALNLTWTSGLLNALCAKRIRVRPVIIQDYWILCIFLIWPELM